MDITTATLDQLKILAWDETVKRDTANNNLNLLWAEMQKRAVPVAAPALPAEPESAAPAQPESAIKEE